MNTVKGDHSKGFRWLMENGVHIYTNDETADHFEVVTGEKMIGAPERIPFEVGGFKIVPFYLPHTSRTDEGELVPCPNFGYLIQSEEMGTLLYATDMQVMAKANGDGSLINQYGSPIVWDMDRCPFIYEETNGMQLGLPVLLDFKSMRINHMLIETNYIFAERFDIDSVKRRHVIRGHHSAEVCASFIKKNQTPDLRTVTLIHLSRDTDEENILRQVKEVAGKRVDVAVAHPGLEVDLRRFPF